MILNLGLFVIATPGSLDRAATEFFRMGVKDGRAELIGEIYAGHYDDVQSVPPSELLGDDNLVPFGAYTKAWHA